MSDQLVEMRGTGVQTDSLIEIYKKLADATQTQAEAAKTQARVVEELRDQQLRAYLFVDHTPPRITDSHADMDVSVHFVGLTPAYDLLLAGTY